MDGLRQRLGARASVINAGVGGQITWDLRQRLDVVAQCRPDVVVLLVGSNDAVGSLGGSWASFYEKGRPQAPSEAWFAEQYDALVSELTPIALSLICLNLPPLGEDGGGPLVEIVQRQNDAIRAVTAAQGIELLDLHTALSAARASDASPGVPFMSGISQFIRWAIASNVRRKLLGQGWDAVGQSRGLVITTDTIHFNDRAGAALVDLLLPRIQHVLSGASA